MAGRHGGGSTFVLRNLQEDSMDGTGFRRALKSEGGSTIIEKNPRHGHCGSGNIPSGYLLFHLASIEYECRSSPQADRRRGEAS